MELIDYAKLSSSYSTFLQTMGEIFFTVLTLVLTVGRDKVDRSTKYRVLHADPLIVTLVSTLITSSIVCFIGMHLLAETAAASLLPELRSRPFSVASINLYLVGSLFILSVALLAHTHLENQHSSVQRITMIASIGVLTGMLLWVHLAVPAYFKNITGVLLLRNWTLVIAIVLFLWTFHFFQSIPSWHTVVQMLTLLTSLSSMCMYALTSNSGNNPDIWNALMYCFGAAIVPAIILGATCRTSLSERIVLSAKEIDLEQAPVG